MNTVFPQNFLWGAATSSYQIEGAALEDGRGECIWHRFSHTPGKVKNQENGDIACDHYHRFHEDVALMKEIGVHAYRFSIAWSRVIPQGVGVVNEKGIDFYDQLIDELLAKDITPFATLYHWDLPQALQDKGGWTNPAIVDWFADYTNLMTKVLGDRVKHWATLNEPWVISFVGNLYGEHAPGNKDLKIACEVAHYLNLAHGKSIEVIRQNVPDAKAGIVLNLNWIQGASDSPEDILAGKRQEGFNNRWFLDPVLKGEYPADIVAQFEKHPAKPLADIDLSQIKQAGVPIDFLGINYYTRGVVEWDENEPMLNTRGIYQEGNPHTEMNWEVYPEGLAKLLIDLNERYTLPDIYITENGAAYNDPAPTNGVVDDPQRVQYFEGHFQALKKALDAGVPLKGYFIWSLMDNFEWAWGYGKRFGIIHVDFNTLKRTFKQSAKWYQGVIAHNGF